MSINYAMVENYCIKTKLVQNHSQIWFLQKKMQEP